MFVYLMLILRCNRDECLRQTIKSKLKKDSSLNEKKEEREKEEREERIETKSDDILTLLCVNTLIIFYCEVSVHFFLFSPLSLLSLLSFSNEKSLFLSSSSFLLLFFILFSKKLMFTLH